MRYRLFAVFLFLTIGAAGQINNDSSDRRTVRIRLSMPQGNVCDSQTKVVLLSAAGISMGEAFTDGGCTVEYSSIPNGIYHLVVSGNGVAESDSESFEVGAQESEVFAVRVNPPAKSESQNKSGAALVSTVELNIPKKAKKEFNRAGDSMAAENWPQAIERLNQAITIYPQFVDAYNNLGVVYARLGDRAREREVLQKAISLDDHFAPAYVNLARADIAERNYVHAEELLNKAIVIDPTDVISLVLLANVQLRTRHFSELIETCSRAHATRQPQHPVVHYLAALAYERESRLPEAMAELKVFLTEEVDGPGATAARKEMAALKSMMH